MEQFINKLKNFVDLEYDTQIQKTYEIWKKPISERVAEGEAINNITISAPRFKIGNTTMAPKRVTLICEENISRFRVGSKVRLHRGNPMDTSSYFSCEIIEDRGNILSVEAVYGFNFETLQEGDGWILDNDLVDIRWIQKAALDELKLNQQGQFIYQILKGVITPEINSNLKLEGEEIVSKLEMNKKQKEAFINAFATKNYYLIQGPPGTGKTWLLAQLAASFAREGEKVLITAFTHRAINNALRKIAAITNFKDIIKIGQETESEELGEVKNYKRLSHSPFNNDSKGVIIGGTCFALRTSSLKEMEFDTVFFDEAGQITQPLAIAGMLAGKKYIFVGDHMQMSPVIVAEHKDKEVTKSIFEYLFEHAPGTMLNITYRMNSAIDKFPSMHFYDNKLISYEENASLKLVLNKLPNEFSEIINPDNADIFIDLKHCNRGVRSPEEAELTVKIISELVNCGISPSEIAVIAPYRAQGRLIRKSIRENLTQTLQEDLLEKILVDTVERIQGQERDVIIILLTTSDPAHALQRAEFYFKPNRLNVAITRPKVKRIVIGSSFLFQVNTEEEVLKEWVNIFKDFYQSCFKVYL